MSLIFLPGTFVSSCFSMSMFDWQEPEGSSVLSSLFWVYWVVTVPLTLAAFSAWRFWLHRHRDHEKPVSYSQGAATPVVMNDKTSFSTKRLVTSVLSGTTRHRSADMASGQEKALAETISLGSIADSEPPTLAPTLVQGPRRWSDTQPLLYSREFEAQLPLSFRKILHVIIHPGNGCEW